jgi:glycosyltransferase involved in cell wall biosynthesis/2-polyprenyl-3-methyl-5-hydroxy-6-metoxy-1,4-benzoquinol methylase/Zn ribbon nucleic-acid-binding protein
MLEHSPKMEDDSKLILQQCPVCSSRESIFLCTKDNYEIRSCSECGSEYVKNAPSKEALKAYYSRKEWFEGGETGGYQNYDEQTEQSLGMLRSFLERFSGKEGSILDVGCGYGGHLGIAAELGWRCFGVELSEHARVVAETRLGGLASIVSTIEELIPHPFDVILMLDVVEHVSNPYELFYPLFASGAIQPHTIIVVSTPNAGSASALKDPANWSYRHPPSHLTYFTQKSLEALFSVMRFADIKIQGLHPLTPTTLAESAIENYAGLLLEATGSDFQQFMQERYVPGTWSEIAEYEHLPRYQLACGHARGRKVLDFGCGTGYGTAMLATVADSALGIDIDSSALEWARRSHRHSNLSFQHNGDFLADFEDTAFDLITCFEMIEHVTESDQYKAIRALARVLRPQGLLLISTPNPEITSLYGDNPYHLRERTRDEFIDLLKDFFPTVQLLDQYALAGVYFSSSSDGYELQAINNGPITAATALAYVAICSHSPFAKLENRCYVDTVRDYISSCLQQERSAVNARLESYHSKKFSSDLQQRMGEVEKMILVSKETISSQEEQLADRNLKLSDLQQRMGEAEKIIHVSKEIISAQERQLATRSRQLSEMASHCSQLERNIEIQKRSRWYRLGERLRATKIHQSALVKQSFSLAESLQQKLFRLSDNSNYVKEGLAPVVLDPSDHAYRVRQPLGDAVDRPIVLHAIANFCLGGSSRLVVDLIESLGENYEQPVVTRYVPSPPAYLDLTIHQHSRPVNHLPFLDLIDHYNPLFVHVHYWGDCDQDWYDHVFHACELRGIRVIQNINTPVTPYFSPAISQNVYVSDYVRRVYGEYDTKAMVIHPGSDLEHFSVSDLSSQADDCVGMVYRLETDKLNSSSIDVFIKVALRRPATRCLIVGDGSLKPVFEKAVMEAGVADNFVFTGYVTYQDLPNYYRQMSVFVAPVWKESFGQVSSFAMNMGLPVVGYSVGAIPAIIGDEGLVIDFGDSVALADLIIRLLDDRQQRLEIGLRNYIKAQAEYSVAAMVKGYSDLYSSMFASIPSS